MYGQVIPLTELRGMSRREIAKINKEMLIASIRVSEDNSHALEKNVYDIFTELRELRNQFSSPESAIN